jgi:hypothetical protein
VQTSSATILRYYWIESLPYLIYSLNILQTAFTSPPNSSGRFTHASKFQYFNFVDNIQSLMEYVRQIACDEANYDCALRMTDLIYADSVDIDFDSISNALIVRALWSESRLSDKKWWETHFLPPKGSSAEVGVLINETPEEPDELRYSGFLTKIGEDDKPGTFEPSKLITGFESLANVTIYSACTLLISVPSPPPSHLTFIQNFISKTNRASSNTAVNFSNLLSQSSKPKLLSTHLLNLGIHAFHRSLPPFRPFVLSFT